MADVKWIKIATNMFEDEKILLLEAMEDGDSLIVLWGKLLCLCGRSNSSGALMITDNLPYSVEMLEIIFRKSREKIVRALTTFERLGMIEYINDDTIYISNWEKHQSLDKLEKKKAYDREYQRRKREEKRLEKIKNEENRTTVVEKSCKNREKIVKNRFVDIDKDIDIDKDNIYISENDKKEVVSPKKEVKHIYGEYKNVRLTDKEYEKLQKDFGNVEQLIVKLDTEKEMKGYKYKSDYLAIRKWVVKAVEEDSRKRTYSAEALNFEGQEQDLEELRRKMFKDG